MRNMMRILSLIVLGVWSSSFAASAALPGITVLQDLPSGTTVEFELQGYEIESVDADGIPCWRITLPGQVTFLKKGFPELPTIARNIIIPDDAVMDARIIDIEYETREVGTILPSKGSISRSVDPNTIPYTFDKMYETDTWWPTNTIELYEPFILRDYRGISVRFNPFQYNPAQGELKIVTRVVVEIFETGKGGKNIITRKKAALNREFVNIYESIFLNFSAARYDSISERAGRMLIITADAYNANMQPFIDWKMRKGIYTKMLNVSSIGNNETAIKNRIQAEYDSTDLVWVLFVGDGNEVVPATGTVGWAAGQDADPVYAYTEGTDYYPDLFISRFSSRSGNAVNIDKQVTRSIGYERNPMPAADWYHIGLGVASNLTGGTGIADSTRMNWLRDSLLLYHYTEVNKSYDPWGTSALIKGFIEDGTSIINYIGHGGITGWGNGGGFSNTNINSLNNPWLLPFVISVACDVGNFNGFDCYCENSVTAGEVNQPDGFVVHWGSAISQRWVEPCFGQEGAVNLLTHDKKNTAGGIFFNGACYMIEHYGSAVEAVDMAQTWTIFGDASLQLRTNTPDNMIVTHNTAVQAVPGSFSVTVKDDDGVTPLEDALVCGWIPNQSPPMYVSDYTNASGIATLNINPTTPGDTMFVTVTQYNYTPYEGHALVIVASGPYVAMGSMILNDGGGNGQANPGEAVDLGIWAQNVGVATAYSVYGLLSESDPYVTITTDSSWYGDIAPAESSLSSPYYSFTIDDNCPNNHGIGFDLVFHDANDSTWTSHPTVIVYAPVLTFENVTVVNDDNSNGILDPGETADIVVTLGNEGGAAAEDVTSLFMTASADITINDATGNFGTISPGDTANNAADPYNVTASSSAPYGTEVDCSVFVESGVYHDTLDFIVTIGKLVPTDTGYYYVYYSGGPHTESPVFDWFEIAPPGPGSMITEITNEDADTVTLALPFTFRYYGQDYTTIGVCSNGFLELGSSTYRFGDNGSIPSPDGPRAMIAPFWDDLDPSEAGDIYQYYDSEGHRWIVEFYQVDHYGGPGNYETFQVILNDPLYYPTPTGDGEIVVQYLVQMQESYSTLGIEDHTETVGIQYYFNGTYHELAVPVTDSFALKYTTAAPSTGVLEQEDFTTVPARTTLSVAYPNPFTRAMKIAYQVAKGSKVSVRVYDVSGRLVRTLTDGIHNPGSYTRVWDARDEKGRAVPAGIYFVRFETINYEQIEKAILLR